MSTLVNPFFHRISNNFSCLRQVLFGLGLAWIAGAFSISAAVGPTPGDEFLGPFASWANVKTLYGATGNGVTDDSAAFQSALNSIGTSPNTSYVLYVPAGTYRITRTLSLIARTHVAVIGENPATTVLKWAGPNGIAMLNLNGIIDSRVNRLTFDGSASAGVAIDESWDGTNSFFDIHNEYADDVLRDVGIGIRGGHLGNGAADSVVLRCQFLRNSVAGVSVENWNALNWFIRDSFFQDNHDGVTNTAAAGNFHVFNCFFQHSLKADIEITNPEYFSIRRNFSTGSGYFFLANPSGTAPNPLTFQGNVILDPTVQAISIGNSGPVMMLDNTIRSSISPAVTVLEGYSSSPVNSNVVSAGNTFSTSNPYKVYGRLLAFDDTTSASINIAPPVMPAAPASLGRAVFEVPSGSNGTAIQQIINNAVAQRGGSRPVVHFPPGTYQVGQALTIPASSDVQLTGDGGASAFLWTGTGAGSVIVVAAPSHAVVADLRINGAGRANGLHVDVNDQPGASIFVDQADVQVTSQNNLLVEGLRYANVNLSCFYNDESQDSVRVVGAGPLGSGPHGQGRVDIFGGGDGVNQMTYDVANGGLLVAEDVWYEGAGPGFVNLTDSGSFTLSGARIYTEDPGHGGSGLEIPPIVINNFSGNVSILNTKIGRGGMTISGQGSNTSVLALGVDGPTGTPGYFQDYSPSAQAALLESSWRTTVGGSIVVPDQTANIGSIPGFVRQMIAEVRAANPVSLGNLSGAPTDVRVFRISIEQSLVGIHVKASSSTPPPAPVSVSIVSPLPSQTVSGTILVTAQTSNATVQLQVDGNNVGSAVAAAPYNFSFDTTNYGNGPHTLTAVANSGGTISASAPVSVVVSNVALPPAPSPGGQAAVSGFAASNVRNDFGGWVGMQFKVGASALTVTSLGRQYLAGNTGTHVVKLVRGSDGADVPGGLAFVSVPGGTSGQFTYSQLASPVTLAANTSYYLVSLEVKGGDLWYDYTPVVTTNAVAVNSPVYWDGANWYPLGFAGRSYVPVSFLYSTGAAPVTPPTVQITSPAANATVSGSSVLVSAAASAASGLTIVSVQFKLDGSNLGALDTTAPYSTVLDSTKLANGAHTLTATVVDSSGNSVTSVAVTVTVSNTTTPPTTPATSTALLTGFSSNTARNNYTGWVGMQITTGSTALSVTSLGRIFLSYNSNPHVVKLVRASDGADVVGGSVTVTLPSGTPGQFAYAQLPSPVTLNANSAYYLVSQETSGADQWYDIGPVSSTSAAVAISPVYWSGIAWFVVADAHSAYIPLNLIYSTNTSAPPPPPPTPGPTTNSPLVTGNSPSAPRNNYTGWVGMQFTVGPQAMSVTTLGRMNLNGNAGSHVVKLVRVSDGGDVPGGSAVVSMSTGTPGQFTYTSLASAITLPANTAYYLVSQETSGGDQWYDLGPITAASSVSVNNSVYWSGVSWYPAGDPNTSYVPLSLQYSTVSP